MKIELNDKERNFLLSCINIAIKASDNAIQTAALAMPIVAKLSNPETGPRAELEPEPEQIKEPKE